MKPNTTELGGYSIWNVAQDCIVCEVRVTNDTDEVVKTLDSVVFDVRNPGPNSIANLNFFYAGNICAATYFLDKYLDSKVYQERIAEYPRFTYEEIKEWLNNQASKCGINGYISQEAMSLTTIDSDSSTYIHSSNDQNWPRRIISFDIGNKTTCDYSFRGGSENTCAWSYKELESLSKDEFDEVISQITDAAINVGGFADESIELFGSFYRENYKLYVVFKGDKEDVYRAIPIDVRRNCNGSLYTKIDEYDVHKKDFTDTPEEYAEYFGQELHTYK